MNVANINNTFCDTTKPQALLSHCNLKCVSELDGLVF